MSDPVTQTAEVVASLAKAIPSLLDACTDPQGLDVAELLYEVQQARIALQEVERDVEAAAARALMDDETHSDGLRVERRRSRDRKSWDHDAWKRDVRQKVLQGHGLKGAQGVVTADGEVVDAGVLHEALRGVQEAQGAGQPKSTVLRSLGLSVEDYCESSPGAVHVRVQRIADEKGDK